MLAYEVGQLIGRIPFEGEIDLGGTMQRYQVARVELLEGEYRGIVMEMDYGRRGVLSERLE